MIKQRYTRLALFCRSTVPLDGTVAIFHNPDSCPIPIPECHLSSLVFAMRSKRVIQLGLRLVNWHDILVTGCVKESKVSLRGRVPCKRGVCLERIICQNRICDEMRGWWKLKYGKAIAQGIEEKRSTIDNFPRTKSASKLPKSAACCNRSMTLIARPFNSSSLLRRPLS
jgi:hypothetical protein